jgi:uncharacterized protein (TIGR02145 family)
LLITAIEKINLITNKKTEHMKTYFLILIVLVAASSCKKDDTNPSPKPVITPSNKVTDIDGNVYDTIKIGSQVWLMEDLKATHYRDGSSIPGVADSAQWSNLLTGASCSYNNDSNNEKIYGRLYNWYAVTNPAGISPVGWHIPTDSEWTILINYLGGQYAAGGEMKSESTLWGASNVGATNSSSFTSIPAGTRYSRNGTFYDMGKYAYYWTSTPYNINGAFSIGIIDGSAGVYRYEYGKTSGFGCRCVKD